MTATMIRPCRAHAPLVGLLAVLAVAGLIGQGASRAWAQRPRDSRQVTVFGVVAMPNNPEIDPELEGVASQLRKLLPKHGFKLLGAETERLSTGERLDCDLGDGLMARAKLVTPLDANGKARFRVALDENDKNVFTTNVATPSNQLFFINKKLENGDRLVIGIGARP